MARPRSYRCAAALAVAVLAAPAAAHADSLTKIVDRFAAPLIQQGYAEGLEVAVVIGSNKPAFFNFGFANVGTQASPDPNTLFQIASVTKVFTTNLLGQAQYADSATLGKTLGDFGAELGTLPGNTPLVTLQDLGDFTGGFPTYAGFCKSGQKPPTTGCLPGTLRPTITQYNAGDFAAFFRTYNIGKNPPPLEYLYSDYSLGLLGLLLGAVPGKPLGNAALTGWESLLTSEILRPLKMHSTFLDVPSNETALLAPGYTQAIASAVVRNGGVARLAPIDPGAGYTAAPAVTISGGGGTGAMAEAELSDGAVSDYKITDRGTGYVAPPAVTFGSGTTPAQGTAIVQNGRVTGVNILAGGSYTSAPTVTFTGGRAGGHNAKGTAHIYHDQVVYVQITEGGAGYVDPVTVSIAPGPATSLPVPIWAPAGALKSSAHDLATFAAAALGQTTIGAIQVPAALTAGFATAEMPYACEGTSPSLTGCTAPKSGLAWDVYTSTPQTVAKDGALPGYSSYVLLMPSENTAMVVLANSLNQVPAAPMLAKEILAALYFEGLLPTPP